MELLSKNKDPDKFDLLYNSNDIEEGDRILFSTIGVLAKKKVGTFCGEKNNQCFKYFKECLYDYLNDLKIYFILEEESNSIIGCFYVECNDLDASRIEDIILVHGGSARLDVGKLGLIMFEVE